MGGKMALLAFADGDLRRALRGAVRSAPVDAEALVRKIHPGYDVTLVGDDTLYATYPPDDTTCATVLPGVELLCDRRLVLDRPSELPEHLRRLGAGRRIIMLGMHSAVDWLCFAVWEDRKLVRSLGVSPDGGIEENIGEPFDFERPYWDGLHPVGPEPGWPDQDPYPLPFHPLELGDEAVRALFGLVVEESADPDGIDPGGVHLHEFLVTDPSGAEQEAREAVREQVAGDLEPPRMFQLGPDGAKREIGWHEI